MEEELAQRKRKNSFIIDLTKVGHTAGNTPPRPVSTSISTPKAQRIRTKSPRPQLPQLADRKSSTPNALSLSLRSPPAEVNGRKTSLDELPSCGTPFKKREQVDHCSPRTHTHTHTHTHDTYTHTHNISKYRPRQRKPHLRTQKKKNGTSPMRARRKEEAK